MGRVIAVAGFAGSGKSTLVGGLVRSLGDAVALHIDDYQRITQRPVREIVQWMRAGADFDAFSIPLVAEHLARLKSGEDIVDPLTMRRLAAKPCIIFETHFGRAHRATGALIDFLVWVDVPMDIALARNVRDLLRPLISDPAGMPARERLVRLNDYVENYVRDVRSLMLMQRDRVAAHADLCIDGSQEPQRIVEQVRRVIDEALGGAQGTPMTGEQ